MDKLDNSLVGGTSGEIFYATDFDGKNVFFYATATLLLAGQPH